MGVSAKKIAEFLNARLKGDDIWIERPASIQVLQNRSVVFITNLKKETIEKINQHDEILAIIKPGFQTALKCPHIICNEPRREFAKILKEFFNPPKSARVSSTCVIDDSTVLAPNVSVGEYSVIGANITIGDRTEIRHHVVIADNTVIGCDCIVRSHCVIGEEGLGIASNNIDGPADIMPQLGKVVIGNGVELGTFNTINRGTLDATIIENNVKTAHHVNVGHNVYIGENTIVTSCAEISGSVCIGANVWIGPNVSIRESISIGDGVKIGIGSVVVKNVEAGKIVVGNPAKELRDRNE